MLPAAGLTDGTAVFEDRSANVAAVEASPSTEEKAKTPRPIRSRNSPNSNGAPACATGDGADSNPVRNP